MMIWQFFPIFQLNDCTNTIYCVPTQFNLPLTYWFAGILYILNLSYTDFNMLYIDYKILDQTHAIFYLYFPKAIKINGFITTFC